MNASEKEKKSKTKQQQQKYTANQTETDEKRAFLGYNSNFLWHSFRRENTRYPSSK